MIDITHINITMQHFSLTDGATWREMNKQALPHCPTLIRYKKGHSYYDHVSPQRILRGETASLLELAAMASQQRGEICERSARDFFVPMAAGMATELIHDLMVWFQQLIDYTVFTNNLPTSKFVSYYDKWHNPVRVYSVKLPTGRVISVHIIVSDVYPYGDDITANNATCKVIMYKDDLFIHVISYSSLTVNGLMQYIIDKKAWLHDSYLQLSTNVIAATIADLKNNGWTVGNEHNIKCINYN